MSPTLQTTLDNNPLKSAPWWEILVVMFVYLGLSLAYPSLKLVWLLIPVAYLIAERRLRRRTWQEIGFNFRAIPSGLVKNAGWIMLVSVVIQAITAFGSHFFLPEYAQHIIARLPFDIGTFSIVPLIILALGTFGEEIIYRGLFQGRISAFIPTAMAILLSSLVFAVMHFTPGPTMIVIIDLLSVFIDGLIYGIIFQRSQNVFVAWVAHFLSDVMGIVFLLTLSQG